MSGGRQLAAAILLILGALWSESSLVCTVAAEEVNIDLATAGFILKVPAFVTWPEDQFRRQSVFNISVLGDSTITDDLVGVAEHVRIDELPVEVVQVDDIGEAGSARILHLSNAGCSQLAPEDFGSEMQQVLTTSYDVKECRGQSMIRFLVRDSKIRFIIDKKQVSRSSVKLSFRLLAIAENIED